MASRGGWLEGTMEVISGQRVNRPVVIPGSASCPSSPARPSRSISPMRFPGIQRVPSGDALNRSMHNDSGHGKSTAQIIKDLKASNAHLSAQMAEQEADFMNQIQLATAEMREQTMKMNAQQVAALEARCASAESRTKERDADLTQLKEESAFHRHTIADLKSQLFQLQHEIEEAEYDRNEEEDKWEEKEQEYLRRIEELTNAGETPHSSIEISVPSPQKTEEEISQYREQLEETREKLSDTEARLREAQANFGSTEKEKILLKETMSNCNREWQEKEKLLREEVKSVCASDKRETDLLKTQLEERDETLATLRDDVKKYEMQIATLSAELEQAQKEREKVIEEREADTKKYEMELASLSAELDQVKSDRDKVIAEREGDKKYEVEIATLHTELEQVKGERDKMIEDRNCDKQEIRKWHDTAEEKSKRLDEIDLTKYETQIAALSAELEQVKSDRDKVVEVQEGNKKYEVQIASLSAELEQMRIDRDKVVEERDNDREETQKWCEIAEQKSKRLEAMAAKLKELIISGEEQAEDLKTQEKALKDALGKNKTLTLEVGRLEDELEKLAEANQDLRASDKSRGLRTQLDALVAEKEESETLYKTRQELIDKEVEVMRNEMDRVRSELETAKSVSRELETETVVKLKEEVAALTDEHSKLESDFAVQLANAGSAKKVAVDELECKLKEVEGKLIKEQERASAKEQIVSNLSSELENLQKQSAARQADIIKLRSELVTLEKEKVSIENEKVELEARLLEQEKEAAAASEAEQSRAAAKEQIANNLTAELEDLRRQSAARQEDVTRLRDELITLEKEKAAVESSYKNLETEKSELETRFAKQEKEAVARSEAAAKHESHVQKLQDTIANLETKAAGMIRLRKQLREAQTALVQLDEDKEKDMSEKDAEIAALKGQLQDSNEHKSRGDLSTRVDHSETVLRQEETIEKLRSEAQNLRKEIYSLQDAIQVESAKHEAKMKEFARTDSSRMSSLIVEVERLRGLLNASEGKLEKASANAVWGSSGSGSYDEALRRELTKAKEAVEKCETRISSLEQEMAQKEAEFKSKLQDRDTTISTLVKSSVSQEKKVATLRSELDRTLSPANGDMAGSPDQTSRKRDHIDERTEDVENILYALDEYKETEKRLTKEVETLKNEVFYLDNKLKKKENGDYEDENEISNNLRMMEEEREALIADHQDKLDERDAAIATLVKSSLDQEAQLNELHAEVALLRNAGASQGNMQEFTRLQQESEIFAGQIIEQDEELEEMKVALEERDTRITVLQKELTSMRRKRKQADYGVVNDLQAELDEVREANASQRDELRELRRRVREYMDDADRMVELKADLDHTKATLAEYRQRSRDLARDDMVESELRQELSEAVASKKELAQQVEALENQRAQWEQDTADGVTKEEIEKLRKSLEESTTSAEQAAASLQEMRKSLDEKSTLVLKLEKTVVELRESNESLSTELEKAKQELQSVQEDISLIEGLKERLYNAEQGRADFEKSLISTYERKMSLMKLNKDVTIDNLRKELAEAKGRKADETEELIAKAKALEADNKDLRDEIEAKLQLKNTKILALEQTLAAQEQVVGHMRAEMDQLQSSMERANLTRRAELEEMQQEVIESTARATENDRGITALKMKLEETKLRHQDEVVGLKQQVANLEKESPLVRSVNRQREDFRLTEANERLEDMKWRVSSLQSENSKLRTRLEKAEVDLRTARTEKYRSSGLEDQISVLNQRVQELESDNASLASREVMKETITEPPKETPKDSPKESIGDFPPIPSSTSTEGKLFRRIAASPKRRSQPGPGATPSPHRMRFMRRRNNSRDFKQNQDDASSTGDYAY